ncbi:MAG: DUF1638 domain-containing protein [Bacillota bacterium]|nr:DUF1638 domain-containing protein [Bacillota bacterium]MDW7682683.1 DUF1638 domain-containing protein [Bacillota bacterium]
MRENRSFKDWVIVSCGTMIPELNYLQETGFLDAAKILYTTPGLHQDFPDLENQLVKQINQAKTISEKIIVVYGSEYCYMNLQDPYRTIDTLLEEQGEHIFRIRAKQCLDMLVSEEERQQYGQGNNFYWLTPGWIKFRQLVYKGWDKANANGYFPAHTGGALLLDGIGFYENMVNETPEEFLDFSDWMGIPIIPYPVTLERFKDLLLEPLSRT